MRFRCNIAALVVLTLPVLGGCTVPTRIQQDYIAVRDECRGLAEDNFQFYAPPEGGSASSVLASKDRNAVLAQIFSDCMFKNGWTVASPGRRRLATREDDLEFLATPSARAAAAPSSASQAYQSQQGQQGQGQQTQQGQPQQQQRQPQPQPAQQQSQPQRQPDSSLPPNNAPADPFVARGATPYGTAYPFPPERQPVNR